MDESGSLLLGYSAVTSLTWIACCLQAGTAALCCCQTKSQLFVSTRGQNGAAAEMYCQAMDTLDDRLVGCCNVITTQDTRLSRPSHRVPYLILCDVHMQRLLRHNCCPGCGMFCTQVRALIRHFSVWGERNSYMAVVGKPE
jgi:euchromatic histone-lysine N-methyltransferase